MLGIDGGRLTFTAGQRQELERQKMIYRYMMSSMPVPPELLIQLSKFPSISTTTGKSLFSFTSLLCKNEKSTESKA